MINKTIFFFRTVPLVLTTLLPILLVSGPFLSDLSISVISIIFLINSFKNKLIKYYNNIFFKIFFSFYLLIVFSSIVSEHPLFSLNSSLFYFRFGIFALSVWYLIDTNKNFIKYLFLSFLFILSSLIIDGSLQFLLHKNIFGMLAEYDVNGPRISSFFGDEIIMGSYIARLSPIFFALFFYLYSDKNKKKGFLFYYSLIIFFLIEPIIFITGERTSFFLYNLSLALIFFLTNEFKKYKIILAAGTIFLFCSALYLKPEIGNRIFNYSINQMKNIDGEKHLFTSMHTGHYKIAINMFFDNKLIGIGPKNFRKQCSYQKYHELAYADDSKEKVTACSSHPHNVYFQLLAETGIFGFILIFCIFFYFCYKVLRIFFSLNIYKKELANFQICIISAFIVNLWPLSPSGNFFNNYLNIIYFFPIGFYLWSANDELSTKI